MLKKKKIKIGKGKKKNFKIMNLISWIKLQYSKLLPLTPTKIFTIVLGVALFLFITYTYFKFTLAISYDGSQYYQNAVIFNGAKGFNNWITRRCFGFPLILWMITKLFGDSIRGILIGFYLFYIFTLLFVIKFIRMLIKENNLEHRQSFIWVLFILFFLFNPLIIGWGHTLLTEAIIPFFLMLMVYLCIKWLDVEWKDRKKFIRLNIAIIALSIFMFLIKERYAYTAWILFFLTNIISAVYKRSWKVLLQKSLVLIVALVLTVGSIAIWNFALSKNGNTEDFVRGDLFKGRVLTSNIHFHRVSKETYCSEKYIESALITKKEKEKIYDFVEEKGESWCDNVFVYEIFNIKNKRIETEFILNENDEIGYFDVLNVYFKSFTNHPILMLHAYYENYLGILNFEQVLLVNGWAYFPSGELAGNATHENAFLGYMVFQEGLNNCWWQWGGTANADKSLIENMDHFETTTDTNSKLSAFMQILEKWSDITFMFGLLFSFPIFIYGFVMCVKRKNNLSYFLITILSGASFATIMFHVFMQSIIDRYCYPVYPLMLLCLIILCMDKSQKYDLKKDMKKEKKGSSYPRSRES